MEGSRGGRPEWLLNFDSTEGPIDTKWIVGQNKYAGVPTDGDDHIFADLGNDWSVGGTGRDVMYGGWGDDVLNMDDVLTSNGGLNNVTDTNPSWEDLTFGGAGVDVLIINTNGDRGLDWQGEFNTFRMPFVAVRCGVGQPVPPAAGARVPVRPLEEPGGGSDAGGHMYGNAGPQRRAVRRDGHRPAAGRGLGRPERPAARPAGRQRTGRATVDVKNNPGTSGQQTIYATAAGSPPASTGGEGFLTDAQLAPVVAQAKQFWAAALGADRAAALNGLQVVIGDLPQDRLGALVGGIIVIDGTAAGHGWFVDPTPWDDAEFRTPGDQGEAGRMDLLTVLMHELGHVLGYEHEDEGVMEAALEIGTRAGVAPDLEVADEVQPVPDPADEPTAPVESDVSDVKSFVVLTVTNDCGGSGGPADAGADPDHPRRRGERADRPARAARDRSRHRPGPGRHRDGRGGRGRDDAGGRPGGRGAAFDGRRAGGAEHRGRLGWGRAVDRLVAASHAVGGTGRRRRPRRPVGG